MADLNQKAFEAFDDYLDGMARQSAQDSDVDIRKEVLSIVDRDVTVGFVEGSLKNAYPANLRRLFLRAMGSDHPNWSASKHYLVSGIMSPNAEISHKGSAPIFGNYDPEMRLLFIEQGFVASSHSWSECFRRQDPAMACLGYVYDDVSHYFMADYPNRLIQRLNSDHSLLPAELERARTNIQRIVDAKISKYNSQPIADFEFKARYPRRVLVCDQAYADASTLYGLVDDRSFEEMLLAAIRENPDAEVIVKTHPDTFWESGKRSGYFSQLETNDRVTVLRSPLNPYSLFSAVDKVYVGTSQMGLEALLANRNVVCFGAPFYAGWGLTDDRIRVPHRERERTLEELFYYFYHWYTIYSVPGCDRVSELEDAIDFVVANRPARALGVQAGGTPTVTVIIPVYDVERCIEQCIRSVLNQSLRSLEVIVVNDQSPDNSQAIIDRLAAEDPRIRSIILDRNVGQGFARNVGLEKARGDFVLFLDSDDFLASPEHLTRAVAAALADGADMVRGRKIFERVEDEHGKFVRRRRDTTEALLSREIHGGDFASNPNLLHSRHFWLWLYRRSFLTEKKIKFETTRWEERPFALKALLEANRLSSIDSEGFVYRVRQQSTARRRKHSGDYFDRLASFGQVVDLLDMHGAFEATSPLWYHARFQVSQYVHYLLLGFNYRLVRSETPPESEKEFLAKVSCELRRTGIRPQELVFESDQLSEAHTAHHAYELIHSALLTGRFDLVPIAVDLKPVPQALYMATMSSEPATESEEDLQHALNRYARNDKIATSNVPSETNTHARVIVHIGSTKTGSTSIQHFFEHNRPELLRRGIWYPEVGLFWQENRPHKQAGHAKFAAAAKHGNRHLINHLRAGLQLANGSIHTIVLSSEAFFLNRHATMLVDYFSGFDLEMICYLRRQDDWANSQYAEFVAGGAVGRVSCSIQEWLTLPETRERLDYLGLVEAWAEKLPKQKVRIRIFEREKLFRGDVISDFFEATGLDMENLSTPTATELDNSFPLDGTHVEVLRYYNAREWKSADDYLRFIARVTEQITKHRQAAGRPIAKPILLTGEERETLLTGCNEGNAKLSELYLDGTRHSPFKAQTPTATPAAPATAIDLKELQIIEEAFWDIQRTEAHNPKAKAPSSGKAKTVSKERQKKSLKRQNLLKARSRWSLKVATSLLRLFASVNKAKKLEKYPDRFFADSSLPGMSLVRVILFRRTPSSSRG